MPQPKSHIFISYNRKDSAFALQLARDLRTAGAEVWIDQLNIAPGANWDYEVQKALSGCATFLVVLTPAAVASEHVLDEIHFALQEGKRIIPVLLESCSIPMRLSRKQHIDFTGDQQRGRGRLFASLGLKMPAAAQPPQPVRAQKPVEKPARPKPVEKEPAIPARRSTPEPRRQSGVIWLGSIAGVAAVLLLVWYFGMREDSPPAGSENMPVISLADSLYKQRLARGNTFLANGQLDSAKAAFQKALDYKKDDPIAINMLTRIDSIETAEKKKASDQLQFTQNRNDGDRHYDTGRWQEAKIAYTAALKYQDDRMIRNRLSEIDKKIEAEQKLAFNQKQFTSYKNNGDRHYNAKRWQEAKTAYSTALKYREDRTLRSLLSGIDSKIAAANKPDTFTRRGITFVKISGGTFDMGALWDDIVALEKPVHKVTVSDFAMSAHEITNAQFCAFLNVRGNKEEGGSTWLAVESQYCLIEQRNGKFAPKQGFANHPVIMISWYGARAFCEWLGGRLPTEAEWEYAARAGGKRIKYPNGNTLSHYDANFYGTGSRDRWVETAPVGQFASNALGLYDMAGNVWEWCNDWYSKKYYETCKQQGTVRNPQGSETGSRRVLRGSSFGNTANSCRVYVRYWEDPVVPGYMGIRVVLPQ